MNENPLEYHFFLLEPYGMTIRIKKPFWHVHCFPAQDLLSSQPHQQYANVLSTAVRPFNKQEGIIQHLPYISLEIDALINNNWIRFVVADEDVHVLKNCIPDPITQESIAATWQHRRSIRAPQEKSHNEVIVEEKNKENEGELDRLIIMEEEMEEGGIGGIPPTKTTIIRREQQRPTLKESLKKLRTHVFTFILACVALSASLALMAIPLWAIESKNGWGYGLSLYVVVITLTTVGYGEFAPSRAGSRAYNSVCIIIGVPLLTGWIAFVSQRYLCITSHIFNIFNHFVMGHHDGVQTDANHYTESKSSSSNYLSTDRTSETGADNNQVDIRLTDNHPIGHLPGQISISDGYTTFSSHRGMHAVRSWFQRHHKVRIRINQAAASHFIQISLQVSVVICFVLLGSMVLSLIENWNYGIGLYFSLVSLSTIGYGELVVNSRAGRAFLCVYLLFGIGLLGVIVGMIIGWYKQKIENNLIKRIVVLKKKAHSKLPPILQTIHHDKK